MVGRSFWRRHVAVTLLFATAGCSQATTVERARDQALAREGSKAVTIAKFSGKITVDGLPPQRLGSLLVMLIDPTKIGDGPTRPVAFKVCNTDGTFAFNTYAKDDGYLPGHYILAFAALRRGMGRRFFGPDALNNLYNDPDVNANKPEFVLDLAAPGKTDYRADLKLATEQPIEQPGPRAIVGLN